MAAMSNAQTPSYDFIVCGSGSSGSVLAGRLAENSATRVLLLEAGGDDDLPAVRDPGKWFLNLGTERDWQFVAEPNPALNGRAMQLSMGKVLGGGSSVNLMVWARGHQADWDGFAKDTGDEAWSYESVLQIYRRMEDWHGAPDPRHRGTGGPVFVEPAPDPSPLAPAMVEAAREVGIPSFDAQNGSMMEALAGASIMDVRSRAGTRQSAYRSYVLPVLNRANLTVLTGALVTKILFEGKRAVGVEVLHGGELRRFRADLEVIMSLGAINTPKVLMQSGIGDQAELGPLGIPVVQHLPGVGQNLQDHPGIPSVWEYNQEVPPRNNTSEATYFARSDPALEAPDLQACQAEIAWASPELAKRFGMPERAWMMFGGVLQPKSRGRVRLSGPEADDPVRIQTNMLSHPDDLKAAMKGIELSREVGNATPLARYSKREVMPGNMQSKELEDFVRNGVLSYWHMTCTAKMGRDSMSVVDGSLKVYGVEGLRVADASVFPRIPRGNTQSPCFVVGERAAEALRSEHRL